MAPSITAGMTVPAFTSYGDAGVRSEARRYSGGKPFARVRLAHGNSASRTSFMGRQTPYRWTGATRRELSGRRLLHGEQGGLLMRLCGRRFDTPSAAPFSRRW